MSERHQPPGSRPPTRDMGRTSARTSRLHQWLGGGFKSVVAARVVSALLQAVFFLGVARLIGPHAFGWLAYEIAIAATASIIGRLGMNYALSIAEAKSRPEMGRMAEMIGLAGIVAGSLLSLIRSLDAAFLCAAMGVFTLSQYGLLGRAEYGRFALNAIGKGVMMIALSVPFFLAYGERGLVPAIAIANVLAGWHLFVRLRRPRKLRAAFTALRETFLQNFFVDLSTNLARRIDKIIAGMFLPLAGIGVYQFNLQILQALELLPIALHQYLLPEVAAGRRPVRLVQVALLITVPAVVVLAFALPPVVYAWFGEYAQAVPALQIMLCALLPLTVTAVFNAELQSRGSAWLTAAGVVRLTSTMALIAVLGSGYGVVGMSWAIVLGAGLQSATLLIGYGRQRLEAAPGEAGRSRA